ncbi:MAG: CopG family ribbon-helix-helix protein [Terriglobales bacterium]
MPAGAVITLRLDAETRQQLDRLSKAQRRSRPSVAAEAIREYVAVNAWQIEEIRKGIAEADRGEFASEAEVARVMDKWTGRKRSRRAR